MTINNFEIEKVLIDIVQLIGPHFDTGGVATVQNIPKEPRLYDGFAIIDYFKGAVCKKALFSSNLSGEELKVKSSK